MNSPSTALAGLFGLTGVVMAALESHALSEFIDPGQVDGFRWAVHLQLIHAVALLAWKEPVNPAWNWLVTGCWTAGIVLFSGSIYLLVLAGWTGLGPITPIGGVLLLAGWAGLLLYAIWGPSSK